MIRFLKRYVWPWAEIERLKRSRDKAVCNFGNMFDDWVHTEWRLSCLRSEVQALNRRLEKYERPINRGGRFTSND